MFVGNAHIDQSNLRSGSNSSSTIATHQQSEAYRYLSKSNSYDINKAATISQGGIAANQVGVILISTISIDLITLL